MEHVQHRSPRQNILVGHNLLCIFMDNSLILVGMMYMMSQKLAAPVKDTDKDPTGLPSIIHPTVA